MRYTIKHFLSIVFICSVTIFASVGLGLLRSITSGNVLGACLSIARAIPDLLSLQMSGTFYPIHNSALWYVSSMIIAGYFLSFLYLEYKQFFVKFLAPVIVFIGYAMISYYTGNLDSIGKDKSLIIPLGLIRGFAGMSLGIITFELSTKKIIKSIPDILIVGFEVIILVLLFGLMCLQHHTSNDFLALLCIPPIVVIAYQKRTPFSKIGDYLGCRLVRVFGKQFTLSVYAFSTIVYTIMGKFIDFVLYGPYYSLLFFLPVLFIISWVTSRLADPITSKLLKIIV